jgi:uncharacterized protein (TIGR00255 family)
MTGYGKASCEYNNKKIVIEIKSLNSKQLDVSTRIAALYREKDIELRNAIATRLERGKIDLSLYIEDAGSTAATRINQAVVENYRQQITDTCTSLGIPMPDNMMEIILRMPETLKTEVSVLDENEWHVILGLLDEAFAQIEAFRIQEGQSLYNMFMGKIDAIGTLLAEVEPYEGERIAKIKSRIEEGLKTLEEKISVDRNRLEQEMIFYIEKLDINEEKVRLRNHLRYFIETMDNEKAPGKKLGFIAQEMGREINTLGSKSNHSEMQIIVVKMKDELEQIKEQVLNVL